jgi:tetratricopeptide (TPR) repeat protein
MNTVEKKAWAACDRKEYAVAAELWEQLIASSSNEARRDACRHGYGYALVGLRRYDEARAIWRQLYEKTGSHIYIHQLGMVEREAGEYAKAAELFLKERSMLPDDDDLAKAANLYEQGLIESLIGNQEAAMTFAKECLALSMATEDKIMHGCAYRLLADLSRDDRSDKALNYYNKSRKAFEEAGDRIACREIDDSLKEIT